MVFYDSQGKCIFNNATQRAPLLISVVQTNSTKLFQGFKI